MTDLHRFETKLATIDMIAQGDRAIAHARREMFFEPRSLEAWVSAVEPGSVAFDVGAYAGLFSMLAGKRGAQVVTIEPLAIMQQRVRDNAAVNGLPVVTGPEGVGLPVGLRLIAGAAAEKNGKAQLCYTNVEFTAGASLARKQGPNKITVKTVRLDGVALPPGRRVSAVKVDVERYELPVLRGAAGLLAAHKPVLLVEVLDDAALSAVLDLLPSYTLVGERLDERNVILKPR